MTVRGQGARTFDTFAFLLKRVDYGDSDLVVTFLTEELGRVSALARGARKSQRRFAGALEPIHTLRVRLDDRPGAELAHLREARIERPRTSAIASLAKLEAAGRALAWVRHAVPPRNPEPEIFAALSSFLDRISDSDAQQSLENLAEFGLQLLSALGFGIDFERCIRCGKACAAGQAAMIDAGRGGLICRACGGARLRLDGETRARLAEAAKGAQGVLAPADASLALDLIDSALRAHTGLS